MRSELRREVQQGPVMPFEQIRFLPQAFSRNPVVIAIYGNKVVHFLYSPDYFAFLIESKDIAENYRQYHKYLWEKIAKK